MRAHTTHQPARRTIGAVAIFVIIVGASTLHAQLPARSLTSVAAVESASAAVDPDANSVRLLVGRSAIVAVDRPIARVSLTSSEVADALVTSPSELLVNGKAPGTISMFVWDRAGAIRRFEVIVQRDLDRLSEQIRQIFPGESVEVRASGRKIALSGTVSSKDVVEKVTNLAAGFVETKDEVVSLLQLAQGAPTNQVLLHVRFAEVSRNALTELGAAYYSDGFKNTAGRITTQQFPAPAFDQNSAMVGDRQVFSDFLNLFLFDFKNQLGVVIKALQTKGLFQSLAEPNLVAESGKEASFLAGGEFPIPIAQGSSSGTTITVEYKEFGIRLSFTPTVNGQRINLKVKPEVSSLDFGNAVVLNGFRIPALSTRRTETELELQNGQTFAIAGLLNNTMSSSLRKIPGIGDIPVLGLLFQSKAAQKDQTELVVMITPEILPQNSSGVTPTLPKLAEPFLGPIPEKKVVEPPPPAFSPNTRSELDAPGPAKTADKRNDKAAAKTASPKEAATTLSTLAPAKRGAPIHLDHNGAPIESTASGKTESAPLPETTALPDSETAPARNAAPASDTSVSPASHAMTAAEKKALERAEREERAKADADLRAQAAEAKRQAKQAEEEHRKQKQDEERQAKLDKEQAERDAALAKRAADEARQQAEVDKKHQKVVDEAQAKLKAAEAQYQAALSKKQGQ